MARWEQFREDYPEIFGYLLGQVSHKFVADHRLMDLITLVNSLPLETDGSIQATEGDGVGTGAGLYLPCTFCNTNTVSRETLTCFLCDAHYGDEPSTPEGDEDALNERQAEILRHLAAIESSGWWDTSTDKYQQNVQDTEILINKGLVLRLPNNRFLISDLGKEWVKALPQPSTPAPDADTATGYMVDMTHGKPTLVYNGVPINEHGIVLHISDMAKVVRILDEQTSALRAQLEAAQAENTRLYHELDTMQDSHDDLEHMVNEARRERDAVKALYDGKHERLEELKRELEVSREARKILAKQINDAARYLGLSEDNDENSNKAYNILQGYTGNE